MLAAQSRLLFQLNKFYNDRVQTRKIGVSKTVREITKIVMEVLREVEVQEPRFISSLAEINGRFEGDWLLSLLSLLLLLLFLCHKTSMQRSFPRSHQD